LVAESSSVKTCLIIISSLPVSIHSSEGFMGGGVMKGQISENLLFKGFGVGVFIDSILGTKGQ
jgi:hypothetical protein